MDGDAVLAVVAGAVAAGAGFVVTSGWDRGGPMVFGGDDRSSSERIDKSRDVRKEAILVLRRGKTDFVFSADRVIT